MSLYPRYVVQLADIHHGTIQAILQHYRHLYIEGPSGTIYNIQQRYIDSMCGGQYLLVEPVEVSSLRGIRMEAFTTLDVTKDYSATHVLRGLAQEMHYGIILLCVHSHPEDAKLWEGLLSTAFTPKKMSPGNTMDSGSFATNNGYVNFIYLFHWLDETLHAGDVEECRYCGEYSLDDEGYCGHCDCYTSREHPYEDNWHPGDRSAESYSPEGLYEYDDYQMMSAGGRNYYYWTDRCRPLSSKASALQSTVRLMFSGGRSAWAFMSSCLGDPPANTPEVLALLRANAAALSRHAGIKLIQPSGLGMNPSEGYHYIDSLVAYVDDRDKLNRFLARAEVA